MNFKKQNNILKETLHKQKFIIKYSCRGTGHKSEKNKAEKQGGDAEERECLNAALIQSRE